MIAAAVDVVSALVFAGAGAAAIGTVAVTVGPQLRRILRVAAGGLAG